MHPGEYDPRYITGIELFNQMEYFEAHEVWEELWHDCPNADRLFYQSLILAAAALYHESTGNQIGSDRLFQRGRSKMEVYRPWRSGLEIDPFWKAVESALAGGPAPQIILTLPPTPDVAVP